MAVSAAVCVSQRSTRIRARTRALKDKILLAIPLRGTGITLTYLQKTALETLTRTLTGTTSPSLTAALTSLTAALRELEPAPAAPAAPAAEIRELIRLIRELRSELRAVVTTRASVPVTVTPQSIED